MNCFALSLIFLFVGIYCTCQDWVDFYFCGKCVVGLNLHLGDVLEGGNDLLCCNFWFQRAYQYSRFSKGTVLDWKIVTCVSLCMENSLLGSICIFSSLKVETMAWMFLGLQNDCVVVCFCLLGCL